MGASPFFADSKRCALFGLLDEGQELSVERYYDTILPLRALDLRAASKDEEKQ